MNTPICDFVRSYAAQKALRLHMPGHKGSGPLGVEALDITEISGADSLYEADGIIRESECNASQLFGCPTFYSTEGSSQCIRAMLYLTLLHARAEGRAPRIAAARNVHKTFLSAAALLDLDVAWVQGRGGNYLSASLDAQTLERALTEMEPRPTAVYITSPDYLGNMLPVEELAAVCHRFGCLLLVDNAHGAYLRFLPSSRHPMDLGADLCCDSAHKTLPVLTGGAYLHISSQTPAMLREQAKEALALFGSTSPSYLILQSLDAVNMALAGDYPQQLVTFLPAIRGLKARLEAAGWCLVGQEPLKVTITPKSRGYTGTELTSILQKQGIVCEFADPDHLVLMLTPELTDGIARLGDALCALPAREKIREQPPAIPLPEQVLSIRQAVFSPCCRISAQDALGRILARSSVGCPPAVPIVCCGERITHEALECFRYYGIEQIFVVREEE